MKKKTKKVKDEFDIKTMEKEMKEFEKNFVPEDTLNDYNFCDNSKPLPKILYCRDCKKYIRKNETRFRMGSIAVVCLSCEVKRTAKIETSKEYYQLFKPLSQKQRLFMANNIVKNGDDILYKDIIKGVKVKMITKAKPKRSHKKKK